jgi:DNA-binding MarR family transcriptional regulator
MSSRRARRAELVGAFNVLMREVSAQGVLYSQAVAERLGVTSSDLECLDLIVLRGQASAGELAEASGLTTGAITGVIDRLEKAGFAKREADPADRRKVIVRPLPAVATRIMPFFLPMERAVAKGLDELSESELAFLLNFLARARDTAKVALGEVMSMKHVPTVRKPTEPRPEKAPKRR